MLTGSCCRTCNGTRSSLGSYIIGLHRPPMGYVSSLKSFLYKAALTHPCEQDSGEGTLVPQCDDPGHRGQFSTASLRQP